MKEKKATSRELNAMITREKIFKAALNLFSKYGFNNVTVDDITNSVRLSKGTFYIYFPSKENILVEQFKMIDEQYERTYKNLDKQLHAIDQLRAIIDTMSEYVQNTCGVSVIQVVYINQISPSKKTIILNNQERSLYKILKLIITEGIKNDQIRNDIDTFVITKYITREMRGLIYDWCMSDGSFDLIEEGRSYFHFVLTSLNKQD